ncbi:MAG: BTAD domain-containing putative transcriptional regulator [Hyphomicrobiaceae bacterium]
MRSEPCREDLHRLLMECLLQSGHHELALADIIAASKHSSWS